MKWSHLFKKLKRWNQLLIFLFSIVSVLKKNKIFPALPSGALWLRLCVIVNLVPNFAFLLWDTVMQYQNCNLILFESKLHVTKNNFVVVIPTLIVHNEWLPTQFFPKRTFFQSVKNGIYVGVAVELVHIARTQVIAYHSLFFDLPLEIKCRLTSTKGARLHFT